MEILQASEERELFKRLLDSQKEWMETLSKELNTLKEDTQVLKSILSKQGETKEYSPISLAKKLGVTPYTVNRWIRDDDIFFKVNQVNDTMEVTEVNKKSKPYRITIYQTINHKN
ncbi:MAG: hypothetical protein N4A45_10475 [Flavobacteriales bacterium]|jgi:DNA-binding HxlR family transcriptional regulator|nr:hypothetical protein [Flavobacteriales bacterium]